MTQSTFSHSTVQYTPRFSFELQFLTFLFTYTRNINTFNNISCKPVLHVLFCHKIIIKCSKQHKNKVHRFYYRQISQIDPMQTQHGSVDSGSNLHAESFNMLHIYL